MVLTVITVALLYIILSNRYEREVQAWALGTLAILIKFWLSRMS